VSSLKTVCASVPSTATSLRYGTLVVGLTASTPESRLRTTWSEAVAKTGETPVAVALPSAPNERLALREEVLDGDRQSRLVRVLDAAECELWQQLRYGGRGYEARARGEDTRHVVQTAISCACWRVDSLGYRTGGHKGAIGAGVILGASSYCDEVGGLIGGESEVGREWDSDVVGGTRGGDCLGKSGEVVALARGK